MKVDDIINKLWIVTQIVIIYRDQWDIVKECPDIAKVKEHSILYGTVNATRSEKFKECKDNSVYHFGIIDDHLIIVINK